MVLDEDMLKQLSVVNELIDIMGKNVLQSNMFPQRWFKPDRENNVLDGLPRHMSCQHPSRYT